MSLDGADGDDDLFFPGFYFSADLTDRLWISAGYVEGEVDFTLDGTSIEGSIEGSIEEVDTDIIVGWSFAKLDVWCRLPFRGIHNEHSRRFWHEHISWPDGLSRRW